MLTEVDATEKTDKLIAKDEVHPADRNLVITLFKEIEEESKRVGKMKESRPALFSQRYSQTAALKP